MRKERTKRKRIYKKERRGSRKVIRNGRKKEKREEMGEGIVEEKMRWDGREEEGEA